MGQIAHPGRSAALLAGAGLLASITLTGCGASLASATTTLAGVLDARVVHSDGTSVAAVDGLRLRRGDVVRTGPHGRAELHTRGRVVYEGSDAAVQMLDGARSDLRHGALVVDAQHGPGLTLTVAGLRVGARSETALRAERSVTVRIGALAGDVPVDSSTGRHLSVDALTQAVVGGDALPDSTAGTPLRLTDDDGEARAVPALVRDDLALNALAAGIDGTGTSTIRAVTAAWHGGLDPLPTGVASSEQVLPVVIAATSTANTAARYEQAVSLRSAGASWGVVAHRLGTTSAAVVVALREFEKGAATGQVGSVPAALALLAGTGGGTGSSAGAGGGHHVSTPGRGRAGGSTSTHPQPGSSPSASPDPVSGAIDKVLTLLPTPIPTPTSLLPVQLQPLPTASLPALPVGSLLTPVPALLPGH